MKAVFWAGVGTLFPFLMTITGAALVFLLKNQKEDGPCMGFAAGVMSAAAVFSMLLPAMRQKAGGWLTVTLGFALGAAMIAGVDAFLGRTQRLQGVSASAKRRLMMYAAITLHNIPEGMAVGLAFALAGVEGGFAGAAVLALGIGVQNLQAGRAGGGHDAGRAAGDDGILRGRDDAGRFRGDGSAGGEKPRRPVRADDGLRADDGARSRARVTGAVSARRLHFGGAAGIIGASTRATRGQEVWL